MKPKNNISVLLGIILALFGLQQVFSMYFHGNHFDIIWFILNFYQIQKETLYGAGKGIIRFSMRKGRNRIQFSSQPSVFTISPCSDWIGTDVGEIEMSNKDISRTNWTNLNVLAINRPTIRVQWSSGNGNEWIICLIFLPGYSFSLSIFWFRYATAYRKQCPLT